MARNGEQEPLLPPSFHPIPQTNTANAFNKGRFIHIKSASLSEFVASDIGDNGSIPESELISGKFHQSLEQLGVFLAAYLIVGTICFYLVRDDIEGTKTNGPIDALYFSIVTMTTVGYGDLVPNTAFVKVLACVFIFLGTALFGLVLSKAGDYLVEKQEKLLVKALQMDQKLGPSEILKENDTKRTRYKCYLVMVVLSVLMFVGSIFLVSFEDFEPMDAFYCACSTFTTLGYGDESFSTKLGRFFGIFWISTGTLGLGRLCLYVVELLTEPRQRAFANWVLSIRMNNIGQWTADHLDADEVDGAAEFIVHKLKEMGKINEVDISLVLEEFEKLDIDQSRILSASDFKLVHDPETKG